MQVKQSKVCKFWKTVEFSGSPKSNMTSDFLVVNVCAYVSHKLSIISPHAMVNDRVSLRYLHPRLG